MVAKSVIQLLKAMQSSSQDIHPRSTACVAGEQPTRPNQPLAAMIPPDMRTPNGASSLFRGLSGSRLHWMVGLVISAVLLLTWMFVAVGIMVSKRAVLDGEVRQNGNLALALEAQTIRALASADQATLRMRDAVRSGEFQTADFERFANETGLVPQILTQLSLVGPDGRFIGSNIDPRAEVTGPVDLSGREHVQAHLSPQPTSDVLRQTAGNGLFIGKPVLGKVSGKWTIQLSRKITDPDGKTLGVVVASLNPGYFEEIYRGVRLGRQGSVALLGDDRSVRARVIGGESQGMGSILPGIADERRGREGHDTRPSNIDGVERVIAYRRVGDYPLIVSVATSTFESLEDWRHHRNGALVTTALFSSALIAAAFIFLRSVRQLEGKNIALQLSEAQARSASQAKSEFLAAISHELRTPLTSIRGFAELMELRLEQPRYKETAGLIRKASEHLNDLLTEILDLAKVEAGAMPFMPMAQSVRDLVQSTADLFAITAVSKSLDLQVAVAPDVPHRLTCDGLRVKQVLNNLLSNAMKFTAEGSVRIEVDADVEAIRFHVVDTGCGIPAHLHETIFEKFRQADDRVSYQHGGTGLGLALSRALAIRMGGSLTLVSEEGHGARFTLSLPRQRA